MNYYLNTYAHIKVLICIIQVDRKCPYSMSKSQTTKKFQKEEVSEFVEY